MSASGAPLTLAEIGRLREVAEVLVPGLAPSPPALALPDYDRLLQQAAAALGAELGALQQAVGALPPAIDWSALESWSTDRQRQFELVSTAVAGAYFMSPEVLRSIDYATQERRSAPIDQVADELGDGLLDDVLARGSVFRQVSRPDDA